MSEYSYRSNGSGSHRSDGSDVSRRSGSEQAPKQLGGWGAVRDNVGVKAIDTRSRPEQALEVAIRMVTQRTDEEFQRRELGQSHNASGREMTVEEADAAVLQDPAKLTGALTVIDQQGNVFEDEHKIAAMCEEATAYALEQIPEEPGKFTNPMLAFRHAQETAYMRETLKIKVVEAIREKAKDESRQIRRRIRMASERSKPREKKQTGQLLQAAFLTSFNQAQSRGGGVGKGGVTGEGEQKMSLLAAPDPYDDSCHGVTNRCLFQVKNNTRVNQQVLEYLLGYASVVDPDDLEEIEAGAQGLTVARGKGMRELALKYAAHLDQTLPDRHKAVVCAMVIKAADEYSRHERMGTKAEDAYVNRPREGCTDITQVNKDAWLRVMFPDAPWPSDVDRRGRTLEDEYVAALTRGQASGREDGVNPMDPSNGGFNDGMSRAEKVRLRRSGVAGLPSSAAGANAAGGRKSTAGIAGAGGGGGGGHAVGIFNPLMNGGGGGRTVATTQGSYGRR